MCRWECCGNSCVGHIIDQETFDNVQRIRGQVRRYPDGWGEEHPLTGLMYCADCGDKMYVHRVNNGKRVPMYVCGNYAKQPVGTLCKSAHRIKADHVMEIALKTIREVVKYANFDKKRFAEEIQSHIEDRQTVDFTEQRKRMTVCEKRIGELEMLIAKIKNATVSVKNEVMEMIAKIRGRKGRLDLPIVSGKHLRRISDRTALQSADNAEKFITTRKIDSFESLAKFTADREQKYSQLETVHLSKGQKLNRLKELSKMYALFAPIQATYKESQSLKGLPKMKCDREHKDNLSKYPELKERMQSLLQNGEKVTPKQWKAEIQSLQAEYDSIGKEKSKTATELAYAEVISYNRKNLERELQNESRQHNRQQNKTKRSREEEI